MIKSILLSFYSLLIIFSSCEESQKEKLSNTIISLNELKFYNPFNIKDYNNVKFRVIHYLNTDCPECISEIKEWNQLNLKLNNYSAKLILVCYSEDDFEYFRYLCKKEKIPPVSITFLLDTAKSFIGKNNIFVKTSSGKTVLVNTKGEVLCIGNPIRDKNKLTEYIKNISNH